MLHPATGEGYVGIDERATALLDSGIHDLKVMEPTPSRRLLTEQLNLNVSRDVTRALA